MRLDLQAVVREALDFDVPEAPIASIHARASGISHREGILVRAVCGIVIVVFAGLYVGFRTGTQEVHGAPRFAVPGKGAPAPIASITPRRLFLNSRPTMSIPSERAAPATILTPNPRPAPGPAIS